jgi:hypothetical protein
MKLGILFGLGLAAIGGAAYAHKRRGGTFTLDSIKESLDLARSSLTDGLSAAKDKVSDLVGHGVPQDGRSASTDRFGYSEYTVAKSDRDMH